MRELLLSEMLDGDVVDTAHVKEDFLFHSGFWERINYRFSLVPVLLDGYPPVHRKKQILMNKEVP